MEGIVKETNEFWKALVNGKQTDKGDIKTLMFMFVCYCYPLLTH